MEKEKIIERLGEFRSRLSDDVFSVFIQSKYLGKERLYSWEKAFSAFLRNNIQGKSVLLKGIIYPKYSDIKKSGEGDTAFFERSFISPSEAFIDSLILDVVNDEVVLGSDPIKNDISNTREKNMSFLRKAFIVHGHDHSLKHEIARALVALNFEAIILSEQANIGQTIIEKLLRETDVGFAIVLYTPDDLGDMQSNALVGNWKSRARQNVVFEHGLLIGKLGRERVFCLVQDGAGIELPSDIQGVVYLSSSEWKIGLAKEIRAAGFDIDFNKLI